MKSKDEIEKVLENVDTGRGTAFPAMTYENGIEEALQWVLGEITDQEFEPTFWKGNYRKMD